MGARLFLTPCEYQIRAYNPFSSDRALPRPWIAIRPGLARVGNPAGIASVDPGRGAP
jgi:hypothetical protein